jgi:ABC-type transport system involved in cytochrome c biogenesis permease subunit
MKRHRTFLTLFAGLAIAGFAGWAQEEKASPAPDRITWSKAAIDAFAVIPIQDGGRIKPLDTFAGFQLLGINGKRKAEVSDGENLKPMEWLLDCLFYPDRAKTYKNFLIENADVLSMISLTATEERARYSYDDLAPARMTLFSQASQFSQIPDETRTPAQTQLINLAHNVHQFETLTSYLTFARDSFPVGANETLQGIYGDVEAVKLSTVLAESSALQETYISLSSRAAHGEEEATKEGLAAIQGLINQMNAAVANARAMAIIPPPVESDLREWYNPASLAEAVFTTEFDMTAQIAVIRAWEGVLAGLESSESFTQEAETLNGAIVDLAKVRGEFDKVPMELTYYKADFFYNSLYLYMLSFLLVALLWMKPKSRALNWLTLAAVTVPTLVLATGITMRCVIRDRPPVTTLYETILFITAVAVVVALFIEFVNRQRIALSLASILGALGVFLANKYEVIEGSDTMPSMIAVLDTNFWLSTHVTTVTMGYAAGLLASAIAHVYIFAYALGLRKRDPEFYRSVGRMTYGVLCFGLLFATVGTVLGGIWANYSWGRFWGWDPKENGALMIVLWMLIVLHARLGGYIREFGIVMGSVICGMIVVFSWFGVNLLGVGLHSYGFTSGIAKALMIFYVVEVVVLAIGALAWVVRPVPAELPQKEKKATGIPLRSGKRSTA